MKKSSNYRLIFGYLGIFLIFIGCTCLFPLILLAFYPEESGDWLKFFVPGISTVAIGVGLMQLLRGLKGAKLGKHQDSVVLIMVWLLAIGICAIPFILRDDMNFSQAMFETTSGFATIGLTIFQDFDSHIYVFYRAICNLVGGVGLVLIITTAISDRYGLKLYIAEGHSDKPLPNLKKSALVILGIYLGIIFVGTISYMFAGVSLFDALVHSICAVSTGGFSSKANGLLGLNVEGVNFPAVEIISIVLMILGATNFLTHFLIITGKGKKAIKDCEIKLFAGFAIAFVPIFFISAAVRGDLGWSYDSFRTSAFTYVSAITTTGFSNISDLRLLGEGVMILVVFVNIIGGGMGSTSGGVKLYRVAVAGKSFYWGTRERFGHSRMVYPHFINRCGEEKEITTNDSFEAFGYIILYITVLFLGGFLVTLFSDFPYNDSLFEFSNALAGTGLTNGLSAACSNNAPVLWIMIVGMFAGRLEILVIYFAFYRIIRDIFRKDTI
ncbi:MAG: TrkH family potassium uptake protein [Bacilli bacterium]|nr:TrkH family potassium uptake protein [Bacilli bacterium]